MTRTGSTVAVIGLGVIGAPMAANLIDAGYDVAGFNQSPGKAEAYVARGGRRASPLAEAVDGADVVLTVLPDTPDVELAASGEDGVFAHAESGALWIDSITIPPDGSVRGFRVDMHHKDLGIVIATARDAGVATPSERRPPS